MYDAVRLEPFAGSPLMKDIQLRGIKINTLDFITEIERGIGVGIAAHGLSGPLPDLLSHLTRKKEFNFVRRAGVARAVERWRHIALLTVP